MLELFLAWYLCDYWLTLVFSWGKWNRWAGNGFMVKTQEIWSKRTMQCNLAKFTPRETSSNGRVTVIPRFVSLCGMNVWFSTVPLKSFYVIPLNKIMNYYCFWLWENFFFSLGFSINMTCRFLLQKQRRKVFKLNII